MNLATIVYRVLTDPRGWRVDRLKEELGIADRTYRKYRTVLQNDFAPFVNRDGSSMLDEVDDGSFRYLRFRDGEIYNVTDETFPARIGAMYMAKTVLSGLEHTEIGAAFQDWCVEFVSRVRDREFVMGYLLRHSDRYFIQTPVSNDLRQVPLNAMGQIVQGLLFHRKVNMKLQGKEDAQLIAPLTILHHQCQWHLACQIGTEIRAFNLHDIAEARVSSERFLYPALSEYDPQNLAWDELLSPSKTIIK
jgi:hypothetical protein